MIQTLDEISTILIDIKNVEYGKDNYSFVGVIDNVKYGFEYFVVDNIPYIKRYGRMILLNWLGICL